MDVSVVLSLGGLCAVASVAVARWTTRARAVERHSVLLDLVQDEMFVDDPAETREIRGGPVAVPERVPAEPIAPVAPVTPLPEMILSGPAGTASDGVLPAAEPPTGLPPEQLETWLGWVREDLDRVAARTAYLDGIRGRLQDQERLLCELLQRSRALTDA